MVNELDNDTRVIVEATVGPWESLRLVSGKGEALLRFGDRSLQMPEGDAAFTARARTRYPELVAEVRELRSEVAMLRRLILR